MNLPPPHGHLLPRVLDQLGLPTAWASGARVLRQGENDLLALDTQGLVVRISRPGQEGPARREVAMATWLADNGVPVVRPADPAGPAMVDRRPVTVWQMLPEHTPGTVQDVARLLRTLHALPPPPFAVGRLDPFVRLDERIDAATGLDAGDVAWLREHLHSLRERWAKRPTGRAVTVVHGDAWVGNVARHAHGATLLDLERCSIGPPEWDLVSTALKTSTTTWVDHDDYAEFTRLYGRDVRTWEGYELLRDLREMRMTCYFVQHSADERMRAEAALRLGCLRGRQGPRPWPWTPATSG